MIEFRAGLCFSAREVNRYYYLASDTSLRATLARQNADDLKRLFALLPGERTKATRKDELIGALERFLLGGGAVQLWTQLKALDQSAIAEDLGLPGMDCLSTGNK